MRPSVWAAVAAGLWVLCTVVAAAPRRCLLSHYPPDAGGCQGAEGPLRGRGAELGAAQLLLPPQEGSSAAVASLHPQAHGEPQRFASLSCLAEKPIQTRVGSSGCPEIRARVCGWEGHGQMQRGLRPSPFPFASCPTSSLSWHGQPPPGRSPGPRGGVTNPGEL
uniref:Interferon, lambda 4 n=1 Tax=Pan troglodytes TaxID=9598 RepID=A0A2I3SU86_PANTR